MKNDKISKKSSVKNKSESHVKTIDNNVKMTSPSPSHGTIKATNEPLELHSSAAEHKTEVAKENSKEELFFPNPFKGSLGFLSLSHYFWHENKSTGSSRIVPLTRWSTEEKEEEEIIYASLTDEEMLENEMLNDELFDESDEEE